MEKHRNIIPGIIIAFSIIIITEIMFFSGLISAYMIANSNAADWPPLDQPRLPFYISVSNMLILMVSGVFMYIFEKKSKNENIKISFLTISIGLGIIFLIIQGSEWINLMNFGAQSSTGLYASYFYTLIALHGIHVLVGISLLFLLYYKIKNIKMDSVNTIRAFAMFWYFVVLLWPILYFLLYLL